MSNHDKENASQTEDGAKEAAHESHRGEEISKAKDEPRVDETAMEETASEADEAREDFAEAEAKAKSVEDGTAASNIVVGSEHGGRWRRLLRHFTRHKVWTTIGTVVVIIAVLASVPWTRYKIAGLFLKQTVTVVVLDSQTNAPVTSAEVNLAGVSAKTDNHGDAKLRVRVGSAKVTVEKLYYQTKSLNTVVPILKPKHAVTTNFVATGRQVPIVVVNKVTGKSLENAVVKADGSETKTDAKGDAVIVLPPNKATEAATISAGGYNGAAATIQVTTAAVAANNFALTPNGKLYFLSNLSGKIDVVKTNLDGTDRQTVLAGTGFEDPDNTSLLASTDWKYLALQSVRTSGGAAQLNLIDTTNDDKVSNIDEGTDVTFSPVGWDGDDFVYTVARNDVTDWEPGQEAIKSFNAQTGKITMLDQTSGSGTSEYNYIHNFFGTAYILSGKVVYSVGWESSTAFAAGDHQAVLSSVMPDGSNKKAVQTFTPTGSLAYISLDTRPYEADGLYLAFYPGAGDGDNYNFYAYEDGSVKPNTTLTEQTFYQGQYSTYLLSPSGGQTFWQVPTDGKNNLFVGDPDGDNGKQIATLSDYNVYGWYTDNYLLVSKNSSELYIMPVSGGTPIKISDYYKPAQNFNGYGSGYGGL